MDTEEYLNTFSLIRIYKVLINNIYFLLIVTSFFGVGSIIYSLSLPNKYTSSTLVTFPKDESSFSSQLSDFASLGSLAGINLPEDDSLRNFKEAIQVMNSKSFIYDFLDKKDYLKLVMAAESWSPKNNKYAYNKKIFDPDSGKWTRKVGPPMAKKPSPTEVSKKFHKDFFDSNFSLKDESLMLSFSFFSPYDAQEILEQLVVELDNNLRNKRVYEIDKKIEYIYTKIEEEEIESVRNFFSKELESELVKRIIAVNKTYFIFKILDKPSLQLKKSEPSRSLIVIFSTLCGFIFSSIVVLMISISRRSSEKITFEHLLKR
ncbi:Wzz/FepE/Etk N-terminal domain-containing protein [Pseudomonadota bacterium]|nr:Wzz/FepE/Etk N-terminal domain-containing protein [Pseudomonadota bacterium]